MHIKRRAHTDFTGSLTLEAALIFPIAIIVFALLLSLVKCVIAWFVLRNALFQTVDKMADYSYLYEAMELDRIGEAVNDEANDSTELDHWLKKRVYEASLNRLGALLAQSMMKDALGKIDLRALGIANGFEGIRFGGTKVFYTDKDHTALLRVEISYRVFLFSEAISLPYKGEFTMAAVEHPFIGKDPFQTAEAEDSKVYRIGNGDKYHTLSCFLIDKEITELTLSEAQQKGYSACKRCKAWEHEEVFVSKGGESYHTKNCSFLYPDLTAMCESEAIEMGLKACLICIKEGGWFEGNH